MKILVTGATGVYGRNLVERLHRAGHDVVAMARRPPASLPHAVRFAQGDVADPAAVVAAMDGCEVVAHLAFQVSPIKSREQSRRISVGGTQNVVDAMQQTGARRLVFASSAMSYGANPDNPSLFTEQDEQRPAPDYVYGTDKLAAERVIIDSGVEAVLARTAVTVGRNIDNLLLDIFAAPAVLGIAGADMRWQLIHQEDVGRFLATACEGGTTGPVNVAPDDFVPLEEIALLLGKRYVEVSAKQVLRASEFLWKHDLADITPGEAKGMAYLPRLATDRLRNEWGFQCAWSTRDGLLDLRRAVTGVVAIARRRYELPWRLRYPAQRPGEVLLGEETVRPAVPSPFGELDTAVAPSHPAYRACPAAAAPLPALQLTTSTYLLRAAALGALDTFGIDTDERHALGAVAPGVFGHRLYVNEDVVSALAAVSPARMRLVRATYGREVRGRAAWAADTLAAARGHAAHSDARLEATLGALRDELAWFWAIAATGAVLDGGFVVGLEELASGARAGSASRSAHAHAQRMAGAIAGALDAVVQDRAGRLVAQHVLDDANDAQHLTWDELLAPPPDAREIVARRRAEHERLAAVHLPRTLSATTSSAALTLGEEVVA